VGEVSPAGGLNPQERGFVQVRAGFGVGGEVMKGSLRLILGLLAGLWLSGCGPAGPVLATVEGTVLVDGKPVKGLFIEFQPDGGSPSIGETDESGHYVLRFSRERWGAEVTEHTVRIMADEDGGGRNGKDRLPTKYNAKSELKRDVLGGRNVFDFELETGGALSKSS